MPGSYEDLVGEAAERVGAETGRVAEYLEADEIEDAELGVELHRELGAFADHNVRSEVENLVINLYGESIPTFEGEIEAEEGARQAYKFLFEYQTSGSPHTIAAAAVHGASVLYNWENRPTQEEIAEAADTTTPTLRNHYQSMIETMGLRK